MNRRGYLRTATSAGLLAVSGCLTGGTPETEAEKHDKRNLAPGETYHTGWGLEIRAGRPAVSNSLEISQGHEMSDGTRTVGSPANEEFLFVYVSVENTTEEDRLIPGTSSFIAIRGENRTTQMGFDYPFQGWKKLASPVTGKRYVSSILDPKSERHGWLIFSLPASEKKTILELGESVPGPYWELYEELPENPTE